MLNHACCGMVCTDIAKESYDSVNGILGGFDSAELEGVFETVFNDCSMIPDEGMGYTLLVNMIFGDIRLDLYRRRDRLKSVIGSELALFSNEQRIVLEKLYGLTDGVRRSYEATALEMHMPLPMVEWYESAAYEKLRHSAEVLRLSELFCEEDNDTAELDAFNGDVKLAELNARIENGELTEEERAFFDLLNDPLPDDLNDMFE